MRRPCFVLSFCVTSLLGCAGEPSKTETSAERIESSEAVCAWRAASDVAVLSGSGFKGIPRDLSVSEIRSDLACLEQVFEHEYVAAALYETEGVSLRARLEELARDVDAPMAQDVLMQRLFAIHAGAYDLHMRYIFQTEGAAPIVRGPRPFRVFHVATPFEVDGDVYRDREGRAVVGCTGFTAIPNAGAAGVFFVGQFSDSVPTEVACALEGGGTATYAVAERLSEVLPPDLAAFKVETLPGDVTYVRIPDFATPGTIPPDRQAFLDALSDETQPEKALLVDLRGNAGGDPLFAWKVAAALTKRGEPVLEGARSWEKLGVLSYAGLSNTFVDTVIQLEAKLATATTPEEVAALTAKINATNARAEQFRREALALEAAGQTVASSEIRETPFPADFTSGAPFVGTRSRDYEKPIVVLIDKKSGSAAEGLPTVLSGRPNVRIVGAPTAGAVRFGTPGLYVLPHSKITFRGGFYGIKYGSLVREGEGIPVTDYVAAGDSLAAAKLVLGRM